MGGVCLLPLVTWSPVTHIGATRLHDLLENIIEQYCDQNQDAEEEINVQEVLHRLDIRNP